MLKIWLRQLVKGGQNVRLASELTGWTINVMTIEDAQKSKKLSHQTLLRA